MDQARLDQLTSWIDEPTSPVWKEVAGMVLRRQIFGQFMDIWYEAPDVVAESGGEFAHWVRWIYRDAQAHAIRRQAEGRNDVHSMGRFLVELSDCDDYGQTAKRDFERLKSTSKPVKDYVDQYLAHLADPKVRSVARPMQPPGAVSWEDINGSVDLFVKLLEDWNHRLRGVSLHAREVWTGPWEYAFRFPWVSDVKGPADG